VSYPNEIIRGPHSTRLPLAERTGGFAPPLSAVSWLFSIMNREELLAPIDRSLFRDGGDVYVRFGSHTNPGRDMNSPAGMSPSNVPVSKLDHLDLLVCKLIILTCQSANSSILQLPVRELIDCFAYSLS
jgi:hypothetical protein